MFASLVLAFVPLTCTCTNEVDWVLLPFDHQIINLRTFFYHWESINSLGIAFCLRFDMLGILIQLFPEYVWNMENAEDIKGKGKQKYM